MALRGNKNTTHIIFGLGMSGLSCARYFDRIGQSYQIIDTRITPPGADKISELAYCQSVLFGFECNEKNINAVLKSCKQLIVSPGIPLNNPLIVRAKKEDIDVCGDIEIFARSTNKSIVAITGSNGKSTVTDLTEQLINAAEGNCQKGGNIGLAVLDFLPKDDADIYVLELSSFQLDSTQSLKAKVAVLLNVSEDHMDRYQSVDDYEQSKKKIFDGAINLVFNADDQKTYSKEILAQNDTFAFTISDKISIQSKYQGCLNKKDSVFDLMINGLVVLSSDELNVTGTHNLSNVLASLGILKCLDIEINHKVIESLKEYRGLAHRFQLVSRRFGCEWINDSKATNVGATVAALNSLQKNEFNKLVLIAGGDSKQSDLSPLKEPLENKVSHLILLGKDAKKIADISSKPSIDFVSSIEDAVTLARKIILEGDVVLLSPACSSLDMFANFEARGDAFISAVRDCA